MIRREARARLSTLKRGNKTSLHSHADEVVKLVKVAYDELPEQHQAEMAVELSLQLHLLAFPLIDIQSAIRAGKEYLQGQPGLS